MTHISVYLVGLVFMAFVAIILRLRTASAPLWMAASFGFFGVTAIVASALQPSLLFDSPIFLQDIWTAYDMAVKAQDGSASSIDYFNPIGPVYDWAFRIAVALHPVDATILPFTNSVFAVVIALIGYLALQGRLSPVALALTLLLAIGAIITPRELNVTFVRINPSWLAPYNRWGWGVFAIVVASLCAAGGRMSTLNAVATGVAIAVLLLLKVTYGIIAIWLALIVPFLLPIGWKSVLKMALATALCLGLTQLTTGQLLPYIADLQTASDMSRNGLRFFKLISQLGELSFWCASAIVVFFLARYISQSEDGDAPQPAMPSSKAVVLILAVGFGANLVLMQNHYSVNSLIYPLLVVLAAEWGGLFRSWSTPLRKSALVLALLFILPRPASDLGVVAAQYVQIKINNVAEKSLIAGPENKMLLHARWMEFCTENVCPNWKRMVEGLDALRAAGADHPEAGTTLTLGFSNPFPFMMEKPSPSGAPIWLHEGRTFTEERHPDPEILFAGTEYVVVTDLKKHGVPLMEIYGDYLRTHFTKSDQNLKYWELYTRN